MDKVHFAPLGMTLWPYEYWDKTHVDWCWILSMHSIF